jgi:hypothetical protein
MGLLFTIVAALASAVILGSEPRGTHDHFYCLRFETSLKLEGEVSIFIFPRNGVAQL